MVATGRSGPRRKLMSTKNAKKAKLTGNDGPPDGPSGHWIQRIPPKGAALLAQMMGRCRFIIKNHGPESVKLVAAQGDLMDLPAGAVRATYAADLIRVENNSEKSVLIEFDFLPYFK
jgi:hypothetical protein